MGARTEPLGTPQLTFNGGDVTQFTLTVCTRSVRKLLIHLTNSGLNPIFLNDSHNDSQNDE